MTAAFDPHEQLPTITPKTLTDEHCELVNKLAKPGSEIADNINAHEAHLVHMVLGISGEAGELLDAIKKFTIYKKPLDLDNVIEELGDLEFYLQGLRFALGISRESTLRHNISKLTKRYGDKYSNEAAQARVDKEGQGLLSAAYEPGVAK